MRFAGRMGVVMALAAFALAWGVAGAARGEGSKAQRAGVEHPPRVVGDWLVSVMRDRFSDATNVIAARTAEDGILSVRCLDRRLSLMVKIFDGAFAGQADLFEVMFRADAAAPVATLGEAIDSGTVEIYAMPGMAAQIAAGREVAFRFHTARARFDRIFAVGAGGDQAVAAVLKACAA